MAFSLPELPYPYEALEPYMSKETLQYHHDKHHMAYVTNGNNLLKDSGLDGLSLTKIEMLAPAARGPCLNMRPKRVRAKLERYAAPSTPG